MNKDLLNRFTNYLLKGIDEFIALAWFAMILDMFYITVSFMLCVIPGKEFNYTTLHILLWGLGFIFVLEVVKIGIEKLKIKNYVAKVSDL